jgi:hypothetical protein
VLKVAVAIDTDPRSGSSVVRLGGGIPVPLLSRLAGCEGGKTLIGLPQDVKRCADSEKLISCRARTRTKLNFKWHAEPFSNSEIQNRYSSVGIHQHADLMHISRTQRTISVCHVDALSYNSAIRLTASHSVCLRIL